MNENMVCDRCGSDTTLTTMRFENTSVEYKVCGRCYMDLEAMIVAHRKAVFDTGFMSFVRRNTHV